MGAFVTAQINMPLAYCSFPFYTGTVIWQRNETELRVFRTEKDRVDIVGLRPWFTYIMNVYMWCGTEMQYYEQNFLSGPGGKNVFS